MAWNQVLKSGFFFALLVSRPKVPLLQLQPLAEKERDTVASSLPLSQCTKHTFAQMLSAMLTGKYIKELDVSVSVFYQLSIRQQF